MNDLSAILINSFMWTELRQNIETIRQENKIHASEFKPVDILSWRQIQEKIVTTFCNVQGHKANYNALWEDFKNETYAVQFFRNWPFDSLTQLVDHSEKVWLFINEPVEGKTKFWFYEGKIETIVFVLGESFVDEVYVASKKYEWLLCINHSDILIATGLNMPDKLRQLEKQNLLNLKDRGTTE